MSDQKGHFRSCPYCGAAGYGDEGVGLRLASTSNGYFADRVGVFDGVLGHVPSNSYLNVDRAYAT